MADKTYWLGELIGHKRVGGIKVGGKLYGIGEPFPADKVDSKKLAGFKKAGCVGSAPFQVADSKPQGECAGCRELGDRINEMDEGGKKVFAGLTSQVKEKDSRIAELETTVKTDGDTIAGLQLDLEAAGGDAKKVGELGEAVKVANGRISELNYEVERLTGEAKEAADKKAAHIEANKTKKSKKRDKKK